MLADGNQRGFQRTLDKRMLPWGELTYRGDSIGAPIPVPLTTMTLTARRGSRGWYRSE